MISDEQSKAFENWANQNIHMPDFTRTADGTDYRSVTHSLLCKAWQAAQEVKPLDFDEPHQYCGVFAETLIGTYEICHTSEDRELVPKGEGYYFERNCRIIKGVYATQDEAIEAANIDYRRRALSCLVNGGV